MSVDDCHMIYECLTCRSERVYGNGKRPLGSYSAHLRCEVCKAHRWHCWVGYDRDGRAVMRLHEKADRYTAQLGE